MSLKDWLSAATGNVKRDPAIEAAEAARALEWQSSLGGDRLPNFIKERLDRTKRGQLPWVSTGSPAELLVQRTHGVRQLGLVSGNCWYHYGYSWTRGHYDGWQHAVRRMRAEAAHMGANAIVDVSMRISRLPDGNDAMDSMDFGVFGTAVRIDGLPESDYPVVATVSALEFMRLLETSAVPVGIAIGAHYEWYTPMRNVTGAMSWWNQELQSLTTFTRNVRNTALRELRLDAQRLGGGALARTQFSELFEVEGSGENDPPRYLARHIAIGSVVVHDQRWGRSVSPKLVISVADKPMFKKTTRNELI